MARVVIASAGPDWASIMTAIGTVAVAAVAVFVALFAEWRADKRVADERRHSDEQLQMEREHSASALAEERRLAAEREQLAEATAVSVRPRYVSPPSKGKDETVAMRLGVQVENRSRYTITDIEAQVSPDGKSLVAAHHKEPNGELWAAYRGVLTPWDNLIEFETDELHISGKPSFYPVVRWRDRWGTHWENKRGEVRQVKDEEEWQP